MKFPMAVRLWVAWQVIRGTVTRMDYDMGGHQTTVTFEPTDEFKERMSR